MAINVLVLGCVIFIGIHLVPAFATARDRLVDRLSQNGYMMLFTILSLVGIALMVWGKSKAPHTNIWVPPAWGHDTAMVIMFPSMVLLAVAKLPTNIKRVTPHPMMWGFILWSFAHLLANGDLASIILFGSIGAYSIIALLSANRRGAQPSTEIVSAYHETGAIGFGVIVYIAMLYLHPYLFGPKLV